MLALLEYAVRGALAGSIYALLAVPMALMFVTVRTIDFAVGSYALIAAAICWTIGGPVGIVAGFAAAVASASLTAAIFVGLKRLGCKDHIVFALASFGLSTVLASLVLWRWGTQAFVLEPFDEFWSIGGIRVSPQSVLNFALILVLVVGLHIIIHATSLGRMMRATAANHTGAALASIPVQAIQVGTYIVGGLLGGLAGLLILFSAGLDFTAPLGLTLSGFAAAIVFGVGSPLRGFFGGVAIGVAQALAAGYASSMVAALVPFLFVLLVLTTSRFGEEGLAGGRP